MIQTTTDLEHQIASLTEQNHTLQTTHTQTIQDLTSKHDIHIQELTTKLHHITDAHSRTTSELQSLLSSQHALSLRWKSESQSLTTRYEGVVSELKMDLGRAEERVIEVENALRSVGVERRELAVALGEERKVGERLRQVVRVAEERAQGLVSRLEELGKRERDAVLERKHLQRDLDRFQIEKERAERERRYQLDRQANHLTVTSHKNGSTKPRAGGLATSTFTDINHLQAEIERIKFRSQSRNQFSPVPFGGDAAKWKDNGPPSPPSRLEVEDEGSDGEDENAAADERVGVAV
ncbi:hypothetical protein HDU97_007408 [Phlyctochytrium planicorne]|nr:hypothetical protein HDU97_007408 [Phlyctochytrium planicorne]